MTSDSAQVRGPVTLFADSAIDVGHGEPHQRRQATVAAGVPVSVKTMVKAAARIMPLSIRRRHPGGVASVSSDRVRLTLSDVPWPTGLHPLDSFVSAPLHRHA